MPPRNSRLASKRSAFASSRESVSLMLRKPSAASAAFFGENGAAGENGRRAAVSFSVDLETRRRRCDKPLDA